MAEQYVCQLADGRFFITDMVVHEVPELQAIIGAMSNYWARHEILDGWVSPSEQANG